MSYKHGIGLSICVNGRPTKEYNHNGNAFVEARHGTNYTVKLKNDNGYKIMAVLSVDGLDVITGKPAEESNKGYILDPYSSVEIKGYRISDENSAAFVFTSKGKSYVQNTKGNARNSGVIGIRAFSEKARTTIYPSAPIINQPFHIHPWNPYTTGAYYTSVGTANPLGSITTSVTYVAGNTVTGVGNSTAYACSVSSNNVNSAPLRSINVSNNFDAPISYTQFDSGTGWGKKLDDKVKKEYFEKGDLLTEIVVYYSTRDALINMGIDMSDSPRVSDEDSLPKAFNNKYCQPPKGWVG